MRQAALTTLRLLVVVALGLWLATRVDWSELGETFARLRPREAVLAVAVLWAGMAVATWRWHRVLQGLGSPLGLAATGLLFGAGLFLSLFLPTGIGGDVYRLARVQRGGFGVRRGALSLAFERGLGLVALLLLVAAAVILNPSTRDLTLLAAALGGGTLALLFAIRVWGRTILDALSARFTQLGPLFGPEARRALVPLFAPVLLASFAIHLSTITACWLVAQALAVPLAYADAVALVPLVVLAGQLPIAPGGLGVREAAFVFFLGRVGIGESQAFAVGLGWLMALYLTGLVGGLLFLFERQAPAREAA